MNQFTERLRRVDVKVIAGLLLGAIVLLLLVYIALVVRQQPAHGLRPFLASPTPPSSAEPGEPLAVTLPELNADPLAYLNQEIEVTGSYLALPSGGCSRHTGPDLRWALTADNLQMDSRGFERIVRILAAGTPMTVQGTWRLYQGPLGCGKAPERGTAWYLEVTRIVQPNPVVSAGSQGTAVEIQGAAGELPDLIATQTAPATAAATPTGVGDTATATFAGTPEATPQATSGVPLAPTVTLAITAAATATPQATPATPGLPIGTPPGGPSNTPLPTATAALGAGTPTLTSEPPPILPTATQTGGSGYPGPGEPTLTPTPTVNPYP